MPRPNITAGIWFRNVRWPSGSHWRTDIPTSVFHDPYVRAVRYALSDGPIVQVPMAELRRALANTPERDLGRKIGPYNIDPFAKRIEDCPVQMTFGPFLDLNLADIHEFHGRGRGHVVRPPVPLEYYRMADIVLERVRAGRISFGQLVDRIQELNPSLTVVRSREGTVSREEIAYVLRINHLRAVKNFEDELLHDTETSA